MKNLSKSEVQILQLSETIVKYLVKQGQTENQVQAGIIEILKESAEGSTLNYKDAVQNLKIVFSEAFGETSKDAIRREAMSIVGRF